MRLTRERLDGALHDNAFLVQGRRKTGGDLNSHCEAAPRLRQIHLPQDYLDDYNGRPGGAWRDLLERRQHFRVIGSKLVKPVILPPGRAMLATKPAPWVTDWVKALVSSGFPLQSHSRR
jgi:hypothetical protein